MPCHDQPEHLKRSDLYSSVADELLAGCMETIDRQGRCTLDPEYGEVWPGTVIYVTGELHRVRQVDLTDVGGRDLIRISQAYMRQWDTNHEINVCFALMGLGLLGRKGQANPVLDAIDTGRLGELRDICQVHRSFENNWEAFNACIAAGRHLVFDEPAEAMLAHAEKIAAKYDATGYFDDTQRGGNYNSYALMSLNYCLRAAELLDEGDAVREQIESRFRPHVDTHVSLIRELISPDGTGWTFGRSAGALGQMQCIALLEQVLAKGWLSGADAAWARGAGRAMTLRMIDLFWDADRRWFCFHDDERKAYKYRKSLPMAWDLLRYYLQLEACARQDERRGDLAEADTIHAGPRAKEIVTDPNAKTAIYVWSDGLDHVVLPIMGGPEHVTGDSLPHPCARGLFEWVTQTPAPVLVPRFVISGEGDGEPIEAWPAWRAARTELDRRDDCDVYRVVFDPLYDSAGAPVKVGLSDCVEYVFSPGRFERIDTLEVTTTVRLESLDMEVLQPATHSRWRDGYGEVYPLEVSFESDLPGVSISAPLDISNDPAYRNYYGHPSRCWRISGEQMLLRPGRYQLTTHIRWK